VPGRALQKKATLPGHPGEVLHIFCHGPLA